jgi:transcriptional regulator with XRE-family HTH domain
MSSKKRQVKQADIVRVFAERLRSLRTAKSLTQSELADRAKIVASYVSILEAGSVAPGIDLLEKLAKALDVNVIDLLPISPPLEVEALREDVQKVAKSVVMKAGRDTLSMLKLFFDRLEQSTSVKS